MAIRIGIIGAGGNTRAKHIPGLQKMEGVEIVRVCNRSLDSSRKVAKEFSIPETTGNWREIAEADDLDAVVIGTWPSFHYPATIASLKSGKHVMCEARMAMSSDEAREMLDVSREHPELVAQVVPAPHTLHVDRTIQRMIAQGYIGTIRAVEFREISSSFPDEKTPLHWRRDRRFSGNNIMSLGIWYETIMRWVGEASKVTAMGRTFINPLHDVTDGTLTAVTIPDFIDVTAEMYCGAQLHMRIGTSVCSDEERTAIIYGSEGTLKLSGNVLRGMQRGDDGLEEIPIPHDEAGGWRVEEEFVGAIRGEEELRLTTFETGLKYMELTDAVSISMAEGRAVSLPFVR